MRRLVSILAACIAVFGSAPAASRREVGSIPPSAERAYQAMTTRVDPAAAFEIVSFMDRYWRLAGNPGYNASIDHIRQQLLEHGFSASAGARASVHVDEFANQERGWDYQAGTLAFDDEPDAPLLSRERDRVSLAINSFSTGGTALRLPLVDVAGGTPADFDNKQIKGAVVLTDAALGRVWQEAVKRRGAAGVISTRAASYVRPAGAAQLSAAQQDVLQWDSIPYDAELRSFGFKASWKAAQRMRERLTRGPVALRVTIESAFYDGPNRTLVAEIPGRSHPAERIVMVAHVQEPGASDNGSGCGTLYALARGLSEAIASGALPPPERTLTFIWGDEMRGSREWMRAHRDDVRSVQYMFALDMTGEDTVKTGGSFLIEKQADPSAVWALPSDPHTEWGAGKVDPASLKGSLLNDLHLAVCLRRARDSDWIVRTNPYEGGSDHTVFAEAGIPSVLNWHFTDRYYHTNQDRPDTVSPAEMKNVGISVATSAWFLASANARDAEDVVALVEQAATRRLGLETVQGAAIVRGAAGKTAAGALEATVRAAWVKWYGGALESVLRLPVEGPTGALRREVAEAASRIR
jgi:aminopeptidase YwaD